MTSRDDESLANSHSSAQNSGVEAEGGDASSGIDRRRMLQLALGAGGILGVNSQWNNVSASTQEQVTGTVADLNNNPVPQADINIYTYAADIIETPKFDLRQVAETQTDDKGRWSVSLDARGILNSYQEDSYGEDQATSPSVQVVVAAQKDSWFDSVRYDLEDAVLIEINTMLRRKFIAENYHVGGIPDKESLDINADPAYYGTISVWRQFTPSEYGETEQIYATLHGASNVSKAGDNGFQVPQVRFKRGFISLQFPEDVFIKNPPKETKEGRKEERRRPGSATANPINARVVPFADTLDVDRYSSRNNLHTVHADIGIDGPLSLAVADAYLDKPYFDPDEMGLDIPEAITALGNLGIGNAGGLVEEGAKARGVADDAAKGAGEAVGKTVSAATIIYSSITAASNILSDARGRETPYKEVENNIGSEENPFSDGPNEVDAVFYGYDSDSGVTFTQDDSFLAMKYAAGIDWTQTAPDETPIKISSFWRRTSRRLDVEIGQDGQAVQDDQGENLLDKILDVTDIDFPDLTATLDFKDTITRQPDLPGTPGEVVSTEPTDTSTPTDESTEPTDTPTPTDESSVGRSNLVLFHSYENRLRDEVDNIDGQSPSDEIQFSDTPNGTVLDIDDGGYYDIATRDLSQYFSRGDSMSISMWVNPDTLDGWDQFLNGNGIILDKRSDSLRFRWYNGEDIWKIELNVDDYLSTDEWTHLAGVLNAGKIARFYVNGQQVGETDVPDGIGYDATRQNGHIRIGLHPSDVLGRYTGQVDQTRLYNGVLSPSQIQQLSQDRNF